VPGYTAGMKSTAWILLALAPSLGRADDWPQFRGPQGTGAVLDPRAPLEWGAGKNIRWRTPLTGRGNSSPIVSKGRVFVTAAEDQGKRRHLHCLDRATGAILWTQTVTYSSPEPTQQDNPYCGSSPCADGERVVVWHSSAGLHCYDFAGKPLWSRDLGKFTHMWGYGASPIFLGNHVVLNCGPGDRTFLVCLDKRTGETVWQADEPGGSSSKWIGSWSTPQVVKVSGHDQILVGYPGRVNAYDPEIGKVLWTCEGLSKLVYADVVVANGIGIATGEDEGGNCIGFRLGGQGNVTSTARLWSRPRPLEVGTGMAVNGHLWTVDNEGIVRCTEIDSGVEVLKDRLPGGAAWSSLVSDGAHLYVTNRAGDTVVFIPDPKKFTPLAVNRLGEPTNATPAISDGEIFLRTDKSAFCIGKGP
jgi:outer membrane protein assembly factor BamB